MIKTYAGFVLSQSGSTLYRSAITGRVMYAHSGCALCTRSWTAPSARYEDISHCHMRFFDIWLQHAQSTVIFTTSPSSLYEEYNPAEMPFKDPKLSIVFETQEMMEETLILLRFNCPDEECSFIGKGWNDLKVHVRGVHGKLLWSVFRCFYLCLWSKWFFSDLCIRSKKVFAHEHTLYTPQQLSVHLPSFPQRGKVTGKEKEVLEGGIHPLCEFCKECFFGGDELFSHMRERHEECFICKRQEIRDQ